MSTPTLAPLPAGTPAPVTAPEPSAATQAAQQALTAAQADVATLRARRAQIPALYAAAVERADGKGMRDAARAGDELDADIAAGQIVVARCTITLLAAQAADARALVAPAHARVQAAEAAFTAAYQEQERAELARRNAWAEESWAASRASSLESQAMDARRQLTTLIAETSARVQ